MGFSLKQLTSQSASRGVCITVHGKGGIGKTTLAVDMAREKNGVVIQSEDGMMSKKFEGVARTGVLTEWTDFTEALEAFALQEHDHKCIVIDTLDKFMPVLYQHIIDRDYAGDHEKAGAYGAYYGQQYKEFDDVLRAFKIIQDRGIDIVVLIHSVVETFKSPDTEPWQRYGLNLPGGQKTNLATALINYSDYVFFAKEDVIVSDGKAKGGNRILATKMSPNYDAKRREDMPDKIALSWEALKKFL